MRLWKVTHVDRELGRLANWCSTRKQADRYKRVLDSAAREIGDASDADIEEVRLPNTAAGMAEWLTARGVS